ncbi:hypothetical protein BUALT_Bualt14G0130900 [Buddleja alternifolia]|uniref:Uncharacterized protein n=1 Tax=Buddleja alternifolia TaxID=168488 RepID=A0AAV6WHF1_9LAMI|nr:hypothetical protein BUALT_Bualt14G0130900 [Buddleja alternifolia]
MDQHGKVSRNYNQISEEEMELRRGPWTVDEDFTLINYIAHHGEGRWNSLARCAGLKRTGKSCRLRWLNYLRPDVRRGNITLEEQLLILELHSRWGNRWSKIAQHLPGRTDNEIKNYWRTRVQKHAKQLRCDVNSKQFKDTMRYLWMPRLVERIQAAAASGRGEGGASTGATTAPSSSTITTYNQNNMNYNMGSSQTMVPQPNIDGGVQMYTSDNSSGGTAAASSDSFGTPVSDLTECNYSNNYNPVNQDYYPAANQSLTSPTAGYHFNQTGMDCTEQNGNWMDCGDVSGNLWDVDDMWFLQHQFGSNA